MRPDSRRWPWVWFGLAVIVLAAGVLVALLVWQARSSSTQEVLDTDAAQDLALGVLENTVSIAEDWTVSDIPGDITSLVVKEQESLALLSGEIKRTRELLEQLEERPTGQEDAPPRELLETLASLSMAQAALRRDLAEIGVLLDGLQPLEDADAAYRQGREALISAIETHNRSVATGSTDFAASRQEASAAAASLQQAEASLSSTQMEGLDTQAAASTAAALAGTAQRFMEACRKGESNDIAGHNSLVAEVRSELSASPASLLSSIAVITWLEPRLESLLQPVVDDLEDIRARINAT